MSNPEAWDCGRANNESDGGQTDKLENYLRVKLRNGCFEDKVNMTGRFLALGWIMSIPEKGHIKRKNQMGAGGGANGFFSHLEFELSVRRVSLCKQPTDNLMYD